MTAETESGKRQEDRRLAANRDSEKQSTRSKEKGGWLSTMTMMVSSAEFGVLALNPDGTKREGCPSGLRH